MLQSLDRALQTLIEVAETAIVVYSRAQKPTLMYQCQSSLAYADGWQNYQDVSYALNPSYLSFRSGRLSGVQRLRDIALVDPSPKVDVARYNATIDQREEIGYLTDGLPGGNEELCIGIDLACGNAAMIAMTRRRTRKGYTSQEIERVGLVTDFAAASLRRYWLNHRRLQQKSNPQRLGKFELLTARELQVFNLLMEGHSSLSISLHLDISVATVKTHRKNLYFKLGVATQCELFSLSRRADTEGHVR
ncbi:hypothetical protein N185_17590 [Sinorhizobium sp. GW3]|nr:hypothetical protein N185_17590 [Sinorhizobium sp. GW3]